MKYFIIINVIYVIDCYTPSYGTSNPLEVHGMDCPFEQVRA